MWISDYLMVLLISIVVKSKSKVVKVVVIVWVCMWDGNVELYMNILIVYKYKIFRDIYWIYKKKNIRSLGYGIKWEKEECEWKCGKVFIVIEVSVGIVI